MRKTDNEFKSFFNRLNKAYVRKPELTFELNSYKMKIIKIKETPLVTTEYEITQRNTFVFYFHSEHKKML